MSNEFFSEQQNMADLVGQMPVEEGQRYARFGHLRVDPAFVDRLYVVYTPRGLNADRTHRLPAIHDTIKVTGIALDPKRGPQVTLRSRAQEQDIVVEAVPRRVFAYPVYVSVPPRMQIKWDARRLPDGKVWRSLQFALLIKTKNRSDFYSIGNTYLETPNEFRRLFPDFTGQVSF